MSAPDRWTPEQLWSLAEPVDENARAWVAVRWCRVIGPAALAILVARTWVGSFGELWGTDWWIAWTVGLLALSVIALFGSLHFVGRAWYMPCDE